MTRVLPEVDERSAPQGALFLGSSQTGVKPVGRRERFGGPTPHRDWRPKASTDDATQIGNTTGAPDGASREAEPPSYNAISSLSAIGDEATASISSGRMGVHPLLLKEPTMDQDTFQHSIRKLLKNVGVTTQQEIEKACLLYTSPSPRD